MHTVTLAKDGRIHFGHHTKQELVACRAAQALGADKIRCLTVVRALTDLRSRNTPKELPKELVRARDVMRIQRDERVALTRMTWHGAEVEPLIDATTYCNTVNELPAQKERERLCKQHRKCCHCDETTHKCADCPDVKGAVAAFVNHWRTEQWRDQKQSAAIAIRCERLYGWKAEDVDVTVSDPGDAFEERRKLPVVGRQREKLTIEIPDYWWKRVLLTGRAVIDGTLILDVKQANASGELSVVGLRRVPGQPAFWEQEATVKDGKLTWA
jgi:hypothetical protein